MLKLLPVALLTISCTTGTKNADQTEKSTPMNSASAIISDSTKSIYQFTVAGLDGGTIDFASFKGKKILVVNTASECGYTPQYKDLEALYQRYKEKLVIVGFPANNFGGQEPGSNEEIKSFCQKNYGVSFPMAAKVSVKGDDMAPIYQWLTSKALNHVMDADVKWNFNKFLIDEQGRLLTKFESRVTPLSDEITSML